MRRRAKWLLLALPLLFAAAFLMSRAEDAAPLPPRVIDFPERLRRNERDRAEARRVLPAATSNPPLSAPPRPRDPLLAALGAASGKLALVIEANAIRFSPIGQMLIQCFGSEGSNDLSKIREETGIDFLQDLDRIALTDDGLILTGNFQNAQWQKFATNEPQSYGEEGRLYSSGSDADSSAEQGAEDSAFGAAGAWKNQMIVFGNSSSRIKAVLDNVEGRTAGATPPISESDTYGEVYGVIPGETLSKVLSGEQSDLARRLQSAAQRVRVHVDLSHDVAMVADIEGSNSQDVQDLGKSLGAALSVASLQARMSSRAELAEILDSARVIPGSNSFRLELALPMKLIEKQLSSCRSRGAPEDDKQSQTH